jgi:hypothetical protein
LQPHEDVDEVSLSTPCVSLKDFHPTLPMC